MADPERQIFTREVILKQTGVSMKTIMRWVADGTFPAPLPNWPGRVLVWDAQEVRAFFIAQLRRQHVPEVDPSAAPRPYQPGPAPTPGFGAALANRVIGGEPGDAS